MTENNSLPATSLFAVIQETTRSYVSALALMISDDQVSVSSIIGFRDQMAKQFETECENAKEYAEQLKKIRLANLAVEFETILSRHQTRIAQTVALRESIDHGIPVSLGNIQNPPDKDSALSSKLPEFDENDFKLIRSLASRPVNEQQE